jgi:thymidylate kinase-like protein
VAYQGAGRDLDGDEVARISRWATDGLVPDLTVLLDVDPMISKARRARDQARDGDDKLESLPDDFHARVRSRFLDLARREPHRYLVVDAGLGVDEIQALIRNRIRDVLPISARRRALLKERLLEEERGRERRAAAEAEVLQMDADLRARRIGEAREREESRRRAREEAERQLQEETDRELRSQDSDHRREEAERRAAAAAHAAAREPVTEKLPAVDVRGPATDEVEAISQAADAVTRAAAPVAPAERTVRLPLVPGFAADVGQGPRPVAERAEVRRGPRSAAERGEVGQGPRSAAERAASAAVASEPTQPAQNGSEAEDSTETRPGRQP